MVLVATLCSQALFAGQIFYDARFDSPLNRTNEPPVVGAGRETPSRITGGDGFPFTTPIVVSSSGHLTNQPLRFKADGFQQIRFDLGRAVSDYYIDFDFETRNLNPSLHGFHTVFDTLVVQPFTLHGGFMPGIHDPFGVPVINWTDNEFHHLHIAVNIATQRYLLQLDDHLPVIGVFTASHGDVFAVRMGLQPVHGAAVDNPDIQVAVDNIVLGTTVPPPPPTIDCSPPIVLECLPDASATLQATVSDSVASSLTVIWNIDDVPYQTNQLPAGTTMTSTNLSLSAEFRLGEHRIVVSASNGQTPPAICATTVTVRDTAPPNILRVKADPAILWPPNHRMVPVKIQVDALDSCGLASCRIVAVQSNGTGNPNKDSEPDWVITSDLAVELRAERNGKGTGRRYTITVECQDATGNAAERGVVISVPRDLGAKMWKPQELPFRHFR